MAGSTWTWNGGSAAASASNWTLTSGTGNTDQQPTADDTAIVADGTVVTGLELKLEGNTIDIGGTAGIAAALIASGDTFINFGTPSADGTTVIASAVPGHTSPEVSVLDAGGVFVNEGTILADGPAGSVFTINVAPTTVGTTTVPGYFFNFGTIEAAAGNTLVLNVGSESELLNTGSIVADGGTVVVNVALGAIAGGDGPVRGFEVIEGGGTLITAASYPASDGNNGTHGEYEFGDSTPGNTLKIENIGSFGGVIIGFGAGDTIDLGTSLTVGTLAYSATTSLLSLEAANGTTLASLELGNFGTGLATGSFPVISGTADGINIGVGADGDTVLTTSGTVLETSGISGIWQAGTSWLGDVVPGTAASASIGLGASAPFTLTTGSTPVSVGGLESLQCAGDGGDHQRHDADDRSGRRLCRHGGHRRRCHADWRGNTVVWAVHVAHDRRRRDGGSGRTHQSQRGALRRGLVHSARRQCVRLQCQRRDGGGRWFAAGWAADERGRRRQHDDRL